MNTKKTILEKKYWHPVERYIHILFKQPNKNN